MAWATAPVSKPEWYWLYAGEDEDATETEYVPGGRVVVHLRVKEYDMQYRGLIMYAIDADGKVVGEWDFVGRPTVFHGHCPQAVVHSSGEAKPYLTSFGFTAPPAGTGKITFKALVKTGVANVGDFFYPNELQLDEKADAVAPEQQWFRAPRAGMSCDEVCTERCASECDASALAAVDSPAAVDALVAPFAQCTLPHVARCASIGASTSNEGVCFYSDEDACDALGLDTARATCAAKADDERVGFRVCPCTLPCVAPTDPPTPAPTPVPPPPISVPTPGKDLSCETTPGGLTCPCGGDSGVRCLEQFACSTTAGGDGVCVPNDSTSACLGDEKVGCSCRNNAECGSQVVEGELQELVCSDLGKCLVKRRFDCDAHLGTVGCWCTEERTCNAGLTCGGDNNCVRPDPTAPCAPGSKGCGCVAGSDCQPGLSCAAFASGNLCVVTPVGGVDSAASLSLAAAATLPLIASQL